MKKDYRLRENPLYNNSSTKPHAFIFSMLSLCIVILNKRSRIFGKVGWTFGNIFLWKQLIQRSSIFANLQFLIWMYILVFFVFRHHRKKQLAYFREFVWNNMLEPLKVLIVKLDIYQKIIGKIVINNLIYLINLYFT